MKFLSLLPAVLLAQTMIHGPTQVRDLVIGNEPATESNGSLSVRLDSLTKFTFCPNCTNTNPGTYRFKTNVGHLTNSWSCEIIEVSNTGAFMAYIELAYFTQPILVVNYSGPVELRCESPFIIAQKISEGFHDTAIPISTCYGNGIQNGFTNCTNWAINTAIW